MIGGAHKLQGWDYNILTDSGGLVCQMHHTADRAGLHDV